MKMKNNAIRSTTRTMPTTSTALANTPCPTWAERPEPDCWKSSGLKLPALVGTLPKKFDARAADEEAEEPEVAVAERDPERVSYEVPVVHGSSTQVSFILPPLEMLTMCLPGAATLLRDPGTASTTSGSSGSGERTSTL